MALHPSHLEQRLAATPRVLRWVVSLGLGAVVALAHEPGLGAWPVLVGFTLACLILPLAPRAAALHGWLLGVGYFAVTLRWIIEPFLVDVARHGWMAPFALILLAGGLALFWGLAGWAVRGLSRGRATGILWFALSLGAVELLRGHIFTGFPWGLPAYALVGGVFDVWLAWVGPYGLTVLTLGLAGVTALALHRGWTLIWPSLVAVYFATVGLQAITPGAPAPTDTVVRVIQPNAAQHLKWDRDWMGVFYDRALSLTEAGEAADVVVWPETSVPTLLQYAGPLFEDMARAARGAPVLAGINRQQNGAFYNAAVVLDGAEVADIYDKVHLVPFGEYIPFAALLRPLGLGVLVDQVAGFSPGTGSGLMDIDGLGRARVLICYEGIFPEEIAVDGPRPDVVVIITNDAWFGPGAGPRQHLVQAQARAIEQGLPVIRSANTGISAVIDARGRIKAQLPLNEAGFVDAAVPATLPPTLYARMGDWPLTVALLATLGIGLARRRRFDVDGPAPRA
ncbi:apolipoprotein N-acyltransferase [Pseudooctadecabacter jejudonensis]|uniref:Apolipoprotein N-acyltransferase n=1 Tax=Pseudooctadecabacter jejudonensis TaxID=1391910 RepID=A0A1Y5SPS0_9RHOB|nr:apolipoprotein N-acyltransferase [Pseudooctadecabacter jejudonensis]SLN44997.1 Apolipoprotein N-acyltransferase [Pseudooctadecabacter jejudonensis]